MKAQVGSKDLDPAGTYTIATNNFVALGDDFEQLKDAPEINQYSACDEALTRFIQKGQNTVDAAAAEVWLTEVKEENSGSDTGDDSQGVSGDTGTGSETNAAVYENTEHKNCESVKTGDEQNPAAWAILCILAVAGGAGAWIYRNRKNK